MLLFNMDARALTRQDSTPVALTSEDIERRRKLDSLRKGPKCTYSIAALEQFLTPELKKTIDDFKRRGTVPAGMPAYRLIYTNGEEGWCLLVLFLDAYAPSVPCRRERAPQHEQLQ